MIKDATAIIATSITAGAAVNITSSTNTIELVFSITFGIVASVVGLGTLWLKWKNHKISLREINLAENASKKNKQTS